MECMELSAGDFFEGTYQLREALTVQEHRARWIAYDYSGSEKMPVVIEMLSYPYDEKLTWAGRVEGLKKVGQSRGIPCRYFVWEEGKAAGVSPVALDDIKQNEKEAFIRIIDGLPVSSNESILSLESPEYWRTDRGEGFIFYRKQPTQQVDPKDNKRIFEFWKQVLTPARLPVEVAVKAPVLPPAGKPVSSRIMTRVNAVKASLIVIGVTLAIIAYYLKPPLEGMDSSPGNATLATFNKAMEEGIVHAQKGNYEQAVEYFTAAANTPESDVSNARMDSLSKVYEAMALAECERYKATQNPELYFIPNQYFHYACLLDGTTPQKKCD